MRRMNDDEVRIVEGEDEVLEVMAKHWEDLGREREDTETEMGDVGGHELVMCVEVQIGKKFGGNEVLEERKGSRS